MAARQVVLRVRLDITAQQVQVHKQRVAQVSIVAQVQHHVRTSVQDAMVPVHLHPVRQCALLTTTQTLGLPLVQRAQQDMRTVVQQRHHTQAAQVVQSQ